MERKKLIWIGMAVGGYIGGFVGSVMGGGSFSFSAIILSAVGGFAGIWFAYKFVD